MNRGYKIVSISCWSGFSRATVETLTDNGVVVLLAGLEQFHQANDPNGLHSVPGVIHCGRANYAGEFWQYGTAPNMNLDVLAMTQGLHRLQPGNTCSWSGTSGTSIGTPHIAGVVALMMDVNPCLTPSDYEEILVATSLAIPDNAPPGTTRGGIIDAYAAVQMAQDFQGIDRLWTGTQTISMDQVSGNLTIESGANIIMDGSLTIASNRIVTIESGARLEVTGIIELGEDTKIIVKRGAEMIVNGGTITNAKGPNDCYKSDQWEAIVVEGNANQAQQLPGEVNDPNGNGVLHLIDAIIENGHSMISMNTNHLPSADQPDHWGGHVTAINTTFTNSNNFTNYSRAVVFMRYPFEDQSSFTRCTISNVAGGMTHWGNNGVTYDNNTFDTYQRHALLTYDAAIEVINGNSFDNSLHNQYDQAAIDMYQTLPMTNRSIIDGGDTPNQFYGGYHSIYSEGGQTEVDPHFFGNNIFTGGQYSMYFAGSSRHQIQENDMIGPVYGTILVSNGAQFNTQRDNQFSNNDVGIFTFFDNSGYDFVSNCFDNTDNRDVRIHGGDILNTQGNSAIAASNVFSEGEAARRIVLSGLANDNTSHFQYHILENTPTTERTVPQIFFRTQFAGSEQAIAPYNVFDADDDEIGSCGSLTSPGPVNTLDRDCDLPDDCDDLPQFIEDLEIELTQEIMTLQSLVQFSANWYISKYRITEIQRCIQKAKQKYIYCKGLIKAYEPIKKEFRDEDLLYKTLVYGMMVENKDYSEARQYLSDINDADEEVSDFVTTQSINLNRLENYFYSPTSTEVNALENIGLKTYPTSGYARSLYRYFTDIKIEVELPYQNGDETSPRSIEKSEDLNISISPNPSQGIYTLVYGGLANSEVTIYDYSGKLVYSKILDERQDETYLELADQPNGVYFMMVRDRQSGSLLHNEKLILVK